MLRRARATVNAAARGGATRAVLVLLAGLLALALLAAWMAGRKIEQSRAAARDVAALVLEAFQVRPKVIIANRTVLEQRTEVLQLVTLEQTLTERRRVDESWLHSTKTLEVEADFVVRVGFDLQKSLVVEMDSAGDGTPRVTLPPAEILSVELRDVRFLRDADGLWNKLTPADREAALRELRLRVALRARESDLRARARARAEQRLAELLARNGRAVTFPSRP